MAITMSSVPPTARHLTIGIRTSTCPDYSMRLIGVMVIWNRGKITFHVGLWWFSKWTWAREEDGRWRLQRAEEQAP